MPVPARLPISQVEEVSPGGAHVLDSDDGARLHGLETSFEEQFLHERITNLHVGPFLLRLLRELGRSHGGAVNAIPARLGSDVDNGITYAGGLAIEDFVVAEHSEREHIDERIAVIAFVEDTFASDGRNAKAVAVMCDSRNHAFQDVTVAVACFRIVQRPEADGIHHSNRPRTHGEDIPEYASDARRGSLERLDEARMIMRLDFEGDRNAIAYIDDPGILARSL